MDTPHQMTRRELLQAIFSSWPARVLGLLLVGVIVTYVAVGIWQARGFLAIGIVIAGLIILFHALSYTFSNQQRRDRLDEESRLTRSHWSYSYRGLLWSGIGVALGNLLVYWSSGRNPTGGLIVGAVLAAFGAVAYAIWAYRRPS